MIVLKIEARNEIINAMTMQKKKNLNFLSGSAKMTLNGMCVKIMFFKRRRERALH